MPNDNNFAAWLKAALAGRPNVYLVKNSGVKENGRPVIDDSRVSKWLKGEQRPSMELATLAARVLGGSQAAALKAAGYPYGGSLESIERMEREHPLPPRGLRMAGTPELDRLIAIHRELGDLIKNLGGDGDAAGDTGRSAPTKPPASGPVAVSVVDDIVSDLIAADEQETSISAEQEESDSP